MNDTTLSKKLTPAKHMVRFLSTSVLILAFSNTTWAELSNGNTPLSDHQYNTSRCDNLRGDLSTAKNDFSRACTKAGLSANFNTCSDALDDCDDSSAANDPRCLNNAISDDREDRISDKINELQADKEEEILNQVELARKKEEVDAKLQETLSLIEDGKADALSRELSALEAITDNIAKQHDELDNLQLGFRKFMLEHEMQCREKAEKYKAAYIGRRREQAAAGNTTYLTQGQLLNHAAISVNQMGAIKYNKYLRNCTALFTTTGRITGFGSTYRLQQDGIKKQNELIQREILRLAKQRSRVRQERTSTLLKLDAQQASALAAHTSALKDLQNQALASDAKKSRIIAAINTQQRKLRNASSASSTAMNQVLAFFSNSSTVTTPTGSLRTVASQSKIDAFAEAGALMVSVENAEDLAEDCDRTQGALNQMPAVTTPSLSETPGGSTVSN